MKEMVREFFQCNCHTEGLILEDDYEVVGSPILPDHYQIFIALWSYGQHNGTLCWKERLRWCWNILKKGIPWTDCVALTPEEAERFGNSILKRIQLYKEATREKLCKR